MIKYLITGGAGFIGSNIVKKLLDNGELVRAVDNFATGRKENITEFLDNKNFDFIEGDITNIDFCKRIIKNIDFVLHEAAVPSVQRSVEDPLTSNDANVNGTLNMLVASRDENIKKFIYASSSSIYGDNPELPKREDFPVRPISPYALTKYVGERYAQIFWQIYGLPTVCLRYFNVFGPKQNPNSQYSAVIPKFINNFLKDETPVIFGTGEQSRDFTFVENVVDANLLAVNSKEKANGQVFNIACNQENSLNQLVTLLCGITRKNFVPEYRQGRQGDVLHSLADISKAKEILGYEPRTQFKQGLEKSFEYYKSFKINTK
ncbi:MAG: NAD-dependent epimerase/dehydratase [Parcubacteria group bacterium GW2011_GWC2_32_10]|nr:MAG: NAD-dependent epimerase/dehydratase [Parcubacteria group bacterium GW2011_GWC2_32_10]